MALMTQVGLEFIARDRSGAVMNQFNRGLTTMTRSILQLAGIGGGIYMLRNTLAGSISEFSNFEKGIAKVSTMLDDQTMHYLPGYTKEIKKMSVTYGEAANNLSTGLYDILSAQIDAADATKVLEQSLRSARGGFTSAAITTQATVQILKAYGMQAEEAGRINDIMHATVKQGRFTFEDYATTIGDVIGLAAYLKIDLEAVGASIATMTKSGLSADKAVTALKNILNQFIYPTQEARDAAAELGFALDEDTIKGSGLIKIMEGLRNANSRQLDTLMPSIRGLVGFASQLKNASEVAKDYQAIVESQGLTQRNFQIAMETTATKIDRARENWNKFKKDLGEKIAPGVTSFLMELSSGFEKTREVLNDFSIVYDEWLKKQKEAKNLARMGPGIYGGFGAGSMGVPPARPEIIETIPQGQLIIPPRRQQYLEDMRQRARLIDEFMSYRGPFPGTEYRVEQEKAVVQNREITAEMLANTRDYLDLVRSMHNRTETEKIKMLDNYRFKHAEIMWDVVGNETKAGEMIRREIELLLESRTGGLEIYKAELERDMSEMGLYISDKFGETARSIEGSMSNAFYSMRQKGQKWHDAMDNFIIDVGDSFARMTSDMAARALMGNIVMPVAGGIGDVLASFFHRGGMVGTDGMREPVSALAFAGAPRMHSGGLAGDEVPIIAKRGETILPAGMKMSAPNIIIYNESGQPIQQKGQPEFDGESWVVSLIAKNYIQGGSLTRLIR